MVVKKMLSFEGPKLKKLFKSSPKAISAMPHEKGQYNYRHALVLLKEWGIINDNICQFSFFSTALFHNINYVTQQGLGRGQYLSYYKFSVNSNFGVTEGGGG